MSNKQTSMTEAEKDRVMIAICMIRSQAYRAGKSGEDPEIAYPRIKKQENAIRKLLK